MSKSPNLSMPFIMPAQAQKHVTHNEAIEILDVLVQLQISEIGLTEPPLEPTNGQIVGIGPGAGGPFEGRDGYLACHYGGGWMFIPPRDGFLAWVASKEAIYVYQGGTWRPLSEHRSEEKVEGLGINAPWNLFNRFSVSAPATLLSHEGAGHQLKINKASEADTASLLFQNAFSGRAEIGLTGSDSLAVKVSADGSNWSNAFTVDVATGDIDAGRITATTLGGKAVQSTPTDNTPGRLMRADWGYGPGNVVGLVSQDAGIPSGAVIESEDNSNGYYVRWADGTQICVRTIMVSRGNAYYDFPATFANKPSVFIGGSGGSDRATGGPNYEGRYRLAAITTISSGFMGDRWEVRAEPATFGMTLSTSSYEATLTAIGRWF